jgi:hypothetical protein
LYLGLEFTLFLKPLSAEKKAAMANDMGSNGQNGENEFTTSALTKAGKVELKAATASERMQWVSWIKSALRQGEIEYEYVNNDKDNEEGDGEGEEDEDGEGADGNQGRGGDCGDGNYGEGGETAGNNDDDIHNGDDVMNDRKPHHGN